MTELEKKSYINLYKDYKEIYYEYERLQKLNKFLMERENKLQLIEKMFKNEQVDLSELSKLVKGSENNENQNR